MNWEDFIIFSMLWNSLNNRKLPCCFFFESCRMCLQNYLGLLRFLEVDLWSSLYSVVIDLFGFFSPFESILEFMFFLVNHAFHLDCQFIGKKFHKIFRTIILISSMITDILLFSLLLLTKQNIKINIFFFFPPTWLSRVLVTYLYFL